MRAGQPAHVPATAWPRALCLRGIVAVLLLSGLVACGGSDSDDDSTPLATGTAIGSPTDAPAGTAPPPPTPRPTRVRPTATATVYSSALIGNVRLDDPAGDVAGVGGNPPGKVPDGLDLRGVEIDGDGTHLLVRWFADARPPSELSFGKAVWSVDIWIDDELVYQLLIRVDTGALTIAVADVVAGTEAPLTLASTFPDRVEAPFPTEVLPRITGPFTWSASATWLPSDAPVAIDRIPDAGPDAPPEPSQRASFP